MAKTRTGVRDHVDHTGQDERGPRGKPTAPPDERRLDYPHLSPRMAEARRKTGLTQVDLAKRLHVSQAAVSRWERGERMIASARLVRALCRALECDAAWLLGIRPEDDGP